MGDYRLQIKPVENLGEIAKWQQAYLRSLERPLDAYWETAVIGLSPHYEMRVDGQGAGYFVQKEGCLLQFFVADARLPAASDLFAQILAAAQVRSAAVSTADPAFLALCLDRQTAVAVNTYLFQDHHPVSPSLPAYPNAHFRFATLDDAARLAQFYGENNEYEDAEAIETGFGDRQQYALSLIEKEQVFLLLDHDEILGIGEYRPSQSQPPYADIGMITNHRFRRQGIGVYILAQLKTHCYRQQADPICSCAFDNIASRKTIEKAGFITQHRILDMQL